MASEQKFVDYVVDQIAGAGRISFRKMFGEYALYCDEKVVALICDNQLFVKPTAGGRVAAGSVPEAPPYPGAKPYLLIDEKLDDRNWITRLVQLTASELPAPKKKAKPTKREK